MSPVTESQAENPILAVNKYAMVIGIKGKKMILSSILYVPVNKKINYYLMPGSLQILVSLFFVFGSLGCVIFFTMVSISKTRQARLLKNVNKHITQYFCIFVTSSAKPKTGMKRKKKTYIF